MRSLQLLAAAAGVTALLVLSAAALAPRAVPPKQPGSFAERLDRGRAWIEDRLGVPLGTSAPEEDAPVLVVLLESRPQLERLRQRLGPSRIRAQGPEAFATHQGSVVASRLEGASETINRLGWAAGPIEILRPGSDAPISDEAAATSQDVIARLAKKEQLTLADSHRLLQSMEGSSQP